MPMHHHGFPPKPYDPHIPQSLAGSDASNRPRSNGTRTFRRPSTTPFNQSTSALAADTVLPPVADTESDPMHLQHSALESLATLRYSKEELLEVAKSIPDSAQLEVSSLFVAGWNPAHLNGYAARGWGKNSEHAPIPQDPSVCWDANGLVKPIGLQELLGEERELFNDVNSTLKLPQQQNKEGNHQGVGAQNGRKASISHGSASNYGMSSPSSASRPGTRRRETTDTNPFPGGALASPTAGRFSREDQSPWFARKGADTKEPTEEPEEEPAGPREQAPTKGLPPTLSRSNTAGTSGFGSTSALWGSSSSTTNTSSASALGAFGSFALPTPSGPDKRFGAGRGESRLAHLIPKDTENLPAKPTDGAPDGGRSWRPRQRTDTDPFGGDDEAPSGSAALGGAQDTSPSSVSALPQHAGSFDTPVKNTGGDFGLPGLRLREGLVSPSETNPYRSPAAVDPSQDDNEGAGPHQSSLVSDQPSNFSTLSRAFGAPGAFDGSDRSQTSSVGAKGYPALSNLTGWPAGPSAGTPDRERPGFASAFGNSIFSPVGELQSPGLGGLGGMFGPATTGSLRGSKLGSLFPPAMQAQMQTNEQESLSDSVPDMRQTNPLGAIARGAIGTQPRETDSPIRTTRGAFEDLFPPHEGSRSPFGGDPSQPGVVPTSQPLSFNPATTAQSFPAAQAHTDPSTAHSRQMVMPDRMRWVYLDPQGQIQGPFSGLEMNDWYKAQFFSPDLRVKKVEDQEFEPLGQLIRRIGNSREPFLVPQMGIAHGQPSQTGPFSAGDGRGAVPPLQSAFPTFGRTLTADEQNALERKKQEDQILAAQQREIMHQHQMYQKFRSQGGMPGALHHHSSAHSLQSQPSFGSMTSPIGMPPQAPIGAIGPNSGFFDPHMAPSQGQAHHGPGGASDVFSADRPTAPNLQAAGPIASLLNQPIAGPVGEGGFRSQLPPLNQLEKDSQGFKDKLHEFHALRAQHEAEEAAKSGLAGAGPDDSSREPLAARPRAREDEVTDIIKEVTQAAQAAQQEEASMEPLLLQKLSLTQQVRRTQADAAAAAAAVAVAQQQAEDAWAKQSAAGLPMPFPPPPQSTTPLPAPTAQRIRSNLPAQYGDRSATGTPDTSSEAAAAGPPPPAPWATQPGSEAQKGPGLKEIQAAEAKKAAKAEEVAAAARRLATEQQVAALREREKSAAVNASGLPATSTWGTGSPVSASSTGSPWAKPAVAKPAPAAGNAASKKTLADIQREEEVRKQKTKDFVVQTNVAAAAGLGKRYADLASKGSTPPGLAAASGAAAAAAGAVPQMPGGGWSTVGAGGKVKIPTGPAAQARSVSTSSVKSAATPVAKPTPRPPNLTAKDAGGAAIDEFNKWLHRELARGLNGVADSKLYLVPSALHPPSLANQLHS